MNKNTPSIPYDIYHLILQYKSTTAWKERKLAIHKLLSSGLFGKRVDISRSYAGYIMQTGHKGVRFSKCVYTSSGVQIIKTQIRREAYKRRARRVITSWPLNNDWEYEQDQETLFDVTSWPISEWEETDHFSRLPADSPLQRSNYRR